MGRLLDALRIPLVVGATTVALLCSPDLVRAQSEQPAFGPQDWPAAESAGPAIEAEPGRAVPVLLGGEPVALDLRRPRASTRRRRAPARITARLAESSTTAQSGTTAVTVTRRGSLSELRVQGRLLMVVTPRDGGYWDLPVPCSGEAARDVRGGDSCRAAPLRARPRSIRGSAGRRGSRSLALLAALWAVGRVLGWARARFRELVRTRRHREGARAGGGRVRSLVRGLGRRVAAILVLLVLVAALDVFLTFALGCFPGRARRRTAWPNTP